MMFMHLGEKERKLLLKALDIDWKNLKCWNCGDSVSYKKCSIMPFVKPDKIATILCDSPLCFVTYLEAPHPQGGMKHERKH